MSKTNNLCDFLKSLADKIRAKKGTTGKINAQDFEDEIESISSGGITPTGSIDITSNGTVDVTNYASANVNVANKNPYTATSTSEMAQYLTSKYDSAVVKYTGTTGTYTNGTYYKVYAVSSNEWTFKELITPVGSTTKISNGTYDVKEYASVVVNVPTYITVASESELPSDSADGTIAIVVGPNLISFIINGTSYQAEDNMTWADWVNSSYNADGYYVSDSLIYTSDGIYKVATTPNNSTYFVDNTDTITNGTDYYLSASGGVGN